MIEKMKFLSITGPKDDIERMTRQYLSKYEIQLENALTEFKTVRNLRPYLGENPYEDTIRRAGEYLPGDLKSDREFPDMTVEKARKILNGTEKQLALLKEKQAELKQER